MDRRHLLSVLTAAAVLLGACSSEDSGAGSTVGADTPSAAPSQPSTVGPSSGAGTGLPTVPEALQFTAPLVGGGTFEGATAAGRPTAFWFWAPT